MSSFVKVTYPIQEVRSFSDGFFPGGSRKKSIAQHEQKQ